MNTINTIIKKAQDDLFPELESKIRSELEKKDKDWLIDQIIYLTCERHSLHEQKKNLEAMQTRLNRIRKVGYTVADLTEFIKTYKTISREELESKGFLLHPPHLGLAAIESHQRSAHGEALLEKARDLLYVSLYGDSTIEVNIIRDQEDMLTITLPESKADALSFLKAVTETTTSGIWKDPEGVSNDDHACNLGLQVEFGDNTDGTIGLAVLVALKLINLLHVNEQILYARLEKVERSSLEEL